MNVLDKIALYNIREYENSINMPDEQRLTYLDEEDFPHLKGGDANLSQYKKYSEECAQYTKFGNELEEVVAGSWNRFNLIEAGKTPQILQDLGLANLPMLYTQKHAMAALQPKNSLVRKFHDDHFHGFDISDLKKFPELMKEPVLVCDNYHKPEERIMMVLPYVDCDHYPVVVCIEPNASGFRFGKEVKTNMITTIFGLGDLISDTLFGSLIPPQSVLYFDKEKGQELERLAKRPFGNYSCLDHKVILRQPKCICKSAEEDFTETSLEAECKDMSAAKDAQDTPAAGHDKDKGVI